MEPYVVVLPVSEPPSDLFWGKTYVGSMYAILREELGVEVDLGSAHFWHPRRGVAVVFMQWPEALFDWQEIEEDDVARWWSTTQKWQQLGTKVVYVRHNFKPHNLSSPAYQALYDRVVEAVDAVVHLGQYSRDECRKFEGVLHRVIQHPKYAMDLPSKEEACARIGLDTKRPTLLVYGAIRHRGELKIVREAARLFREEFGGQVLIGTAPFHLLGRWGRLVKPFVPWFKKRWQKAHGDILHEGPLRGGIEEDYLAASEFMLVPRLGGQLNSGVLIKALSLGITPLATSVGNLAGIGQEVGLKMLEDVSTESLRHLFRHALDQRDEVREFWKTHTEEAWGRHAVAKSLSGLLDEVHTPTGIPTGNQVSKASGWDGESQPAQPRRLSVVRRLPNRS